MYGGFVRLDANQEKEKQNQCCQHCVSKNSGNFVKCLKYVLPQAFRPAQEEPAGGGRFSFFGLKSKIFFCKIKSKVLNSRVLAGGYVMGCAENLGFKHL